MKTPLIPTTVDSTPSKAPIWSLVISSLALVIGSLALLKAHGGTFNLNEPQLSSKPVQRKTCIPADPQVKKPLAAIPPAGRTEIAAMYLEPQKFEVGIELGVQEGAGLSAFANLVCNVVCYSIPHPGVHGLHRRFASISMGIAVHNRKTKEQPAQLGLCYVCPGGFASVNLHTWPSCKRYYLVDIWKQQQNYMDGANVADDVQEKLLNNTRNNLKQWESKTIFLRNFTSDAVTLIKEQVDFIYVDARHDYCGAKQDIELYWPLLKSGGLLAGHDYLDAYTVKLISGQDWALCMDGSRHEGAVKGAVDEFAMANGLTVMITYAEYPWASWLIVKP